MLWLNRDGGLAVDGHCHSHRRVCDGDGRGDLRKSPGVEAAARDPAMAGAESLCRDRRRGLFNPRFVPLGAFLELVPDLVDATVTFDDVQELRAAMARVLALLAEPTALPARDGEGPYRVERGHGPPGDGLVQSCGARCLRQLLPLEPGEPGFGRHHRDLGQRLEMLGCDKWLLDLSYGGGLTGRPVPGAGDHGRNVWIRRQGIDGRTLPLDASSGGVAGRDRLELRRHRDRGKAQARRTGAMARWSSGCPQRLPGR